MKNYTCSVTKRWLANTFYNENTYANTLRFGSLISRFGTKNPIACKVSSESLRSPLIHYMILHYELCEIIAVMVNSERNYSPV